MTPEQARVKVSQLLKAYDQMNAFPYSDCVEALLTAHEEGRRDGLQEANNFISQLLKGERA